MFGNAPIARLVCMLFLVTMLAGLFLVIPAQAQNQGGNNQGTPVSMPEPTSFALLGLGLVGLTAIGLRKKK